MAFKYWWPRLPDDMVTNPYVEDQRRLKVESTIAEGSTIQSESDAYFDGGKSYRFDYVIRMPQGSDPLVLKFDIQSPINLTLSELNLAEGGVHYEVFAGSQVTETTPFSATEVRVFPRNTRESSNPNLVISSGGAITVTGEANTNLFVRTASGGGNRQNAVSSEQSKRGFPVTTAYVRMSILDGVNTDVLGTLKLEYEVVE